MLYLTNINRRGGGEGGMNVNEDQTVNPEAALAQRVVQVAPDLVTVDGRRYAIALDHKQAFDREKFAARYTDILEKYDYIVGDWGYDQLRLRGFYADDNRRANKDQLIRTLQDYLLEYCNFGCAYFVLQRLDAPDKPVKKRSRGGRNQKRRGDAGRRSEAARKPYSERITKKPQVTAGKAETVAPHQPRKRHFTIHSRETNEK